MRWVVMVVGSAALAAAGCDRLPARGGQGEPCFGNGSCREGLTCTEGTCKTEERCQVEEDCPAGQFCDDGVCAPCEDAEHCGPGCETCDADSAGLDCIWDEHEGTGEHRCGCNDDNDCPAERPCIVADMICEGACVPDCDGKCGGAGDDCGGTCEDCPAGQCCVDQQCLEASDDKYCGVDCVDCTGRQSDRLCVAVDGGFRCGCTPQAGCAAGEECLGHSCQPLGQPEPDHELVVDSCSVEALALSGIHEGHMATLLLIGCSLEPWERLWQVRDGMQGDAPDESWSDLSGKPLSLQFEPGSYSIMATDAAGNWLFREQIEDTWYDFDSHFAHTDGGLPDGYVDGGDDGGDGGADDAVGVQLAHWSADGAYILTAADYVGWWLFDADFNQLHWAATMGPFAALAFVGNSALGVAGVSHGETNGLLTLLTTDPYPTAGDLAGVAVRNLAAPAVTGDSAELAGITDEGSPAKVRLWDQISSGLYDSFLSYELNARSLIFLPEQGGAPDRFLLVGTAAGEMRAVKFVTPDIGLRDQVLALDCQGVPVSRMARSPDGLWLATACGNRVQLWRMAVLLDFYDR